MGNHNRILIRGNNQAPMATADPTLSVTWGVPGNLTGEQQAALEEFQRRVDEAQVMRVKYSAESAENFACRFLRARKFDVDRAVVLFEECLQRWAEDRPRELVAAGEDAAVGCPAQMVHVFYPHTAYGFDKMNRPVFYERTGMVSSVAITTVTDIAGMVRYHWINMIDNADKLFQRAAERGTANISVVSVLDLAGMSMDTMSKQAIELLKSIAALDNMCFPELLGKMFIINAPRIFVGVWEIAKRLIDQRTQSKIEIIAQREFGLNRLAEFIDADQLPAEYGGTGASIFFTTENIEYTFVPRCGDVSRQVVVQAGWSVDMHTYVSGYPIDLEIMSTAVGGGTPELHERKTLESENSHMSAHHFVTFRPSETREYTVKWRNTARLQARYVAFALLLRDPNGQLVLHTTPSAAAPAHEETKA